MFEVIMLILENSQARLFESLSTETSYLWINCILFTMKRLQESMHTYYIWNQ